LFGVNTAELGAQKPISVIWVIYVMLLVWRVAFLSVPNFRVHSSNKRLKVTQWDQVQCRLAYIRPDKEEGVFTGCLMWSGRAEVGRDPSCALGTGKPRNLHPSCAVGSQLPQTLP